MAEAFAQSGSGYAVLTLDEEDGTHRVHGVALGAGDITRGMSGLRKKWPAETLREEAESLSGKPLVVNHINHDVESVVGQVTEAGFKKGVGVIFEGELGDDELADKVDRGWIDVSPRVLHEPVDEMEKEIPDDSDDPVHVVGDVKEFINLSFVPQGAAPSNDVAIGEHEDLASLFDVTETSDYDELAEAVAERVLAQLEKHSVHEPEWSDLREGEWEKPSLEDFTDESWDDLSNDEKSDIDDHFIVSKTGFPPDNFGDLALPVVDTEGNLVENAVDNAASRVGQVGGLSGEDLNRAESIIESLQGEFEDDEENEQDQSGVEPLGTAPDFVRLTETYDSGYHIEL